MSTSAADSENPRDRTGSRDSGDVIRDGARLAALRDLGLLDTPAEADFDRYTRLASELLGVPVSLVTLVDADRQFLKSQIGLSGPFAEARQTPLSHSFCQHAVASGRPLVVEDARTHPLVSGNAAIRDLDVIAYAGMPLVLSDGHSVGALCAIDTRPHAWSERDLRILGDLADALRSHLDLKRVLAEQGLRDRLTGLANRSLLAAQADTLLDEAGEEGRGEVFAVCVGLDAFALVNEAYGVERADALLCEVGVHLREALPAGLALGRFGGDTFAVVGRVAAEDEAMQAAERLRAAIENGSFADHRRAISLTATVGIAFGGPQERGADLLARADDCMRAAKGGGPAIRTAVSRTSQAAMDRLHLRGALGEALRREELHCVYQPIVGLEDRAIAGYEALARWESPELGSVPPSVFVPIAESTGAIVELGERVLRDACAALARWREARPDVCVSVNLAPLQLEVANLPELVASLLDEHDLPPSCLLLEITESTLIGAGELETRVLARLRELGVMVALDDFGTGYSALGYLARLPVDMLKIDRSFVERIEHHDPSVALVRAILALGEGLGLQVVAEGIEREGQRERLRELGCRLGQGSLFGVPRPASELSPG